MSMELISSTYISLEKAEVLDFSKNSTIIISRKTSTAGHRPSQVPPQLPFPCFSHQGHQMPRFTTGQRSPAHLPIRGHHLTTLSGVCPASNVSRSLPLKSGNSSGYNGYVDSSANHLISEVSEHKSLHCPLGDFKPF